MATHLIYEGRLFKIYAWKEKDSCQVLDFLSKLDEESNNDSKRLVYLIQRTASVGIIKNERQSRLLENGIYEFKAPNTSRILYFLDKGSIIICTHGFGGKHGAGKTVKKEIERATEIKDRYLRGKNDVKNKKQK